MPGLGFSCVAACVLISTVRISVGAAQPVRNPVSTPQKPAGEVIADYVTRRPNDGKYDLVRGLFWRGCPKDDPRRDSIFTGLLKLEPTPGHVTEIAISWQGALSMCNDQRLDEYFRTQARETTDPLTLDLLSKLWSSRIQSPQTLT